MNSKGSSLRPIPDTANPKMICRCLVKWLCHHLPFAERSRDRVEDPRHLNPLSMGPTADQRSSHIGALRIVNRDV